MNKNFSVQRIALSHSNEMTIGKSLSANVSRTLVLRPGVDLKHCRHCCLFKQSLSAKTASGSEQRERGVAGDARINCLEPTQLRMRVCREIRCSTCTMLCYAMHLSTSQAVWATTNNWHRAFPICERKARCATIRNIETTQKHTLVTMTSLVHHRTRARAVSL